MAVSAGCVLMVIGGAGVGLTSATIQSSATADLPGPTGLNVCTLFVTVGWVEAYAEKGGELGQAFVYAGSGFQHHASWDCFLLGFAEGRGDEV